MVSAQCGQGSDGVSSWVDTCGAAMDQNTGAMANAWSETVTSLATGQATGGSSIVFVQRNAGDVTYLSDSATQTWFIPFASFSGPPPYYVLNCNADPSCSSGTSSSGVMTQVGSQYSMQLQFSDGTNAVTANPVVPITPFSSNLVQPYSCSGFTASDGSYSFQDCSSMTDLEQGVSGLVSF
jgi:hypothetical protein